MQQISTLFLQSEIEDPYTFYETMSRDNPVYRDHAAGLYAIYSYQHCKTALDNSFTRIPATNIDNKDGLNEYALLISGKLARLSNGASHEIARLSTSLLFENTRAASPVNILDKLLDHASQHHEIDWVNIVANKLPGLLLLDGFDFTETDAAFISAQIPHLSKLIVPVRTNEQVAAINDISKEVYDCIKKHLLTNTIYKNIVTAIPGKYGLATEEVLSLCVCNLTGLLIQGYDAGRGLLSNSLLQILTRGLPSINHITKEFLQQSVIETLRFDPPVHNTRRIATDDFLLGDTTITKGNMLLIVLAAANRDPLRFNNPAVFDIHRSNNSQHLTFGAGMHSCLANHYSVNMVTETLAWLFEKYKKITLTRKNISYEPLVNVRLPRNIFISLN